MKQIKLKEAKQIVERRDRSDCSRREQRKKMKERNKTDQSGPDQSKTQM